jgi:hypothetical protein
MCRLRFFEIYIDLGSATMHDFDILSSLMGSLYISLTSSTSATLEHLDFNLRFRGNFRNFNSYIFYGNLRDVDVWSHLDSIATHPSGSRLQRVNITINFSFRYDSYGKEPDQDEVLKAVLDGLPLLRMKGILFVKAVLGE